MRRSWWNKIFVNEDKNKKDDNTLVNQINHFVDVVSKKVKPKVNGNDGLISLKIFAAITKSAKTGKKVRSLNTSIIHCFDIFYLLTLEYEKIFLTYFI